MFSKFHIFVFFLCLFIYYSSLRLLNNWKVDVNSEECARQMHLVLMQNKAEKNSQLLEKLIHYRVYINMESASYNRYDHIIALFINLFYSSQNMSLKL